jgi:Fur family ferric uptake transcriptional regulator
VTSPASTSIEHAPGKPAPNDERAQTVHQEVARLLGLTRRRYTANGRRFVSAVLASGRPLTAEEACQAEPDLALSTVYRIASILVEAGALRIIPTADGILRFELAESMSEHHHHLICIQCGVVLDYAVPATLERALERAAEAGARTAGFHALAHRFDVEGICADCVELAHANA